MSRAPVVTADPVSVPLFGVGAKARLSSRNWSPLACVVVERLRGKCPEHMTFRYVVEIDEGPFEGAWIEICESSLARREVH